VPTAVRGALRQAPITLPCLLVVGLFVAWAQLDAGLAVTTWAPGALGIVGLLAVAAAVLPGTWEDVPRVTLAAVALLAAFTLWSYASLLWAGDPGAAWQGANRTLLYLAVFALFALWPQRGRTGSWVLGAWVLGLQALAVVTLARIPGGADALFAGSRLDEPAGYTNAEAALWLMAFWPAVLLAASPATAWWLRGLLAGGAVLLADLALLVQSRGSVFAVPLVALLGLAVLPGRVRFAWALAAVLAGVAVGLPTLLDVGTAVEDGAAGATDGLVLAVAGGALVSALWVALWGVADSARGLREDLHRAAARAGTGLAIAVGAAGLVAGAVVVGNPVERVADGWDSFRQGYEGNDADANRLVSGLGSNRYDFYRVALDEFADRPVTGTGADNFFAAYLRDGRSEETPRFPHSVELRTLSQLGIVGALLLLGFLGCVALGAWRAMRGGGPAAAAVAGGAVLGFAYWFVHGSVDWFFEIAGLGAPAFALAGLALSLVPRAAPRAPGWTLAPWTGAVGAGVLAAVVLALPWWAERDALRAADLFVDDPLAAYRRLDRAATLDPLSNRADMLAGSIALRYGDLGRARSAFGDAVQRRPDDPAALLQLGAVESAIGNGPTALALLDRATRAAPRNAVAREARDVVVAGGVVDPQAVARRLLDRGRAFLAD
jgi:hypothetical protein